MASETDPSFFIPFILGLTAAGPLQDSTNPPQETQDQATPRASRDRIIVINPLTQTMAVFETNTGSLGFGSLFGDLFSRKSGQRPASKSSIDNLPRVEMSRGEKDDQQCVVCLEEWEDGERAKEMPCEHRFHGECIEKWLRINGCCPVCRYEMPVDEDDDSGKKDGGEDERERREILVTVSFGGLRNWESSDHASDHQETED